MNFNYGNNASEEFQKTTFTVVNGGNNSSTDYVKPDLKLVKNVVVADDAAVVRLVIKNTLQNLYNVYEVTNGDDAIKILQSLDYDAVVFLDLKMPESDGFKVLKVLDEMDITIPITVISGDDSMATIQQVCKKPNVDYISKPLGKMQVLAATERMFRQKEMSKSISRQKAA